MKSTFLLCTGLALLAPAFVCAPLAAKPLVAKSVGRLVEVRVHDRTANRDLPVYHHRGRYFVAGQPGHDYQIRIRNRQSDAVLAVVSVDAVNVISGETASWDSIGSQTGYVFDPRMEWDIKGWRKSMERIAGFNFTEIDNSYAARTGRPDNVGVIGVAVFRKKQHPPMGILGRTDDAASGAWAETRDGRMENRAQESATAQARSAAPASSPVPPASKSLGTGHGASETSAVTYTGFERASERPDEVIAIHYDSHANLVAQGVIPVPVGRLPARPDPFPGYRGGPFVPDPS